MGKSNLDLRNTYAFDIGYIFLCLQRSFLFPKQKLLIDNDVDSVLIYMNTRSIRINFFGHKNFFKNLSYIFI